MSKKQNLPGCDEIDSGVLRVDQARDNILSALSPVNGVEQVAVRSALGRILAQDVLATIDVPSHTNSAMDGYAILAADIPTGGSKKLNVVATVMAGAPIKQTIAVGECARIMTGGKMPAGTDTVIMQEHVKRVGDGIEITGGHKPQQNVRQAGEDLANGERVFGPGKKLSPADIGMLASMGIAEVRVRRRVRVAFFSTGDELCSVGQTLDDGQIYDSNRYTLYGMLKNLGVDFIDMGIIPDQREPLEKAFFTAAAEADVLITSGGVSVGEADFVKETLNKIGQVGFWKIAMKPGKPLAFGNIEGCQFFGLPGNPVSAMVTFYQFVQPALRHLMGEKNTAPLLLQLKTDVSLKKRPGRLEYQRGIMANNANGELVVRPTGAQGSGILSSMGEANCFIVLPLECSKVDAGQTVTVQPFAGLI
ncbi:MAG: molybdopterin molybdenumtransferase MoeA [Gammaproteobacteria bacterium]|nr:molybdopterin molybdenumtransferase MoeA [Gammaproteobacteria bacterium]